MRSSAAQPRPERALPATATARGNKKTLLTSRNVADPRYGTPTAMTVVAAVPLAELIHNVAESVTSMGLRDTLDAVNDDLTRTEIGGVLEVLRSSHLGAPPEVGATQDTGKGPRERYCVKLHRRRQIILGVAARELMLPCLRLVGGGTQLHPHNQEGKGKQGSCRGRRSQIVVAAAA